MEEVGAGNRERRADANRSAYDEDNKLEVEERTGCQ